MPAPRGAQGPTQERLELAERVRLLRQEGLLIHEIADTFGISRSYTSSLLNDPRGEGDRKRKESYAQPCPRCGAPMSGSNGRSIAPLLCVMCAPDNAKTWDRDAIVLAFQNFERQFGRPPSASDVLGRSPSQRAHFGDKRLAEIDEAADFSLPVPWVVSREFGSWNAALSAAGFVPNKQGGAGHREVALGTAQRAVLSVLDEPLRLGEIEKRTGLRRNVAPKALRSLTAHGLVEKVSRGVYRRTSNAPLQRRTPVAREFVVLHKNGNGWLPGPTVEAATPSLAIEKVASDEGVFVAVPVNYWNEMQVGTVTKLAVLSKPEAVTSEAVSPLKEKEQSSVG